MGRPRGGSRDRVVEAALEALKTKGFAGASTRAIAALGGFRPGLIFYYFDSLDDLLVAALEHSSRGRLERYREAVDQASSPAELIGVLRAIYDDDVASGHIRVVSELVGASVADAGLRPRVLALMQPWLELAERGVRRSLGGTPLESVVPVRAAATAAVTFYLGANLLTHLQGEDAEVSTLLELGSGLARLVEPGDSVTSA